jgi:hypothetical protein
MWILSPVLLLLFTTLTLLLLRLGRSKFKHGWLVAAGGTTLSLASVFLWRIGFPYEYRLPAWQPETIFPYSPAWLADGFSWPYALTLAGLSAAVIWTSVVRAESDPLTWAASLLVTAFGLLAVSAANPLTLVLAWTAIDLAELVAMLRSTQGPAQTEGVMVAFAARLIGTALVVWVAVHSAASGIRMDFASLPSEASLPLLLATGLRLGILPLHLPYQQETTIRRGFGTILRLVSAASSLALLTRVPSRATDTPLTPYLLVLVALGGLYAGWMWLRASDELTGRPFWLLGMAALALGASLRANPAGSAAWGLALLTGGGFLFLYSARQRASFWLVIMSGLGLSALPFLPTASGWLSGSAPLAVFILPYLPIQALMLAGFIRHALHPGEVSLESQPRWARGLYLCGLIWLILIQILTGLWGWEGAAVVGVWWAALISLGMAVGLLLLAIRFLGRVAPSRSSGRWADILRLNWLYRLLWSLFRLAERLSTALTGALEGEGGILWSLLLLVLLLSLFTGGGR